MRGFVEGGMRGNHISREEFYRRAIDIVEWGRSVWKGVSIRERGSIFEETFLRGLRGMHLDALMQVRTFSALNFDSELIMLLLRTAA
jgi:stress-induced-phosphoprotein 1